MTRLGIHCGCRLIEEQQRGSADQRSRQGEAPLLATRQLAVLHVAGGAPPGVRTNFPPLKMYNPETKQPNHNNVATYVALTGKTINIKKGQFVNADMMRHAAAKVASTGNPNIWLTERGTMFGYNDLIVDPRAFYHMRRTGYPVVFDITHSIRKYGIPSADPRGGNRDVMPTIARAGVAAGVDGVFIETHPDPSKRSERLRELVPKARAYASKYPVPNSSKRRK